jgi:PAS domain S-box-containing protein
MDHFDFMPHGMCYLWRPDLLALHVISDGLITLAYFSIPFTLLYFVRRRRDLEFNWMFVCFAVFIVACGTTHLMEIVTVWQPAYWLSGGIKAITALASVPTAILLVRLIPRALAIPGPAALRREIEERQRAEQEVRRVNEELEARVADRTAELEAMNVRLRTEARQREEAEDANRRNRQLLEAVIDNSPAVIYVKQADGRYLLTNRRYEEIFHIGRGQMLGRTDFDLFEHAAADAFRAMDQRVIAAGGPISEVEIAPQPDGTHTYISVKAPLRDANGRIYAIFGVSTDITEQMKNEERLRAQLEHLRLLERTTQLIGERQDLHSIFEAVLSSVEDHLFVDLGCICMRGGHEHRLAISAVGPRSKPLADQLGLHEQGAIDRDAHFAKCLAGELAYEPDLAQSTLPMHVRLVQLGIRSMVSVPLIVESKAFGVLTCARRTAASFSGDDLDFLRQLTAHVALAAHQAQLYDSLQRAYEDLRHSQQSVLQQERLRALGQMASGIAHDINNALSPAALYTQVLRERETALSEESKERLAIIQRAIEDVANTVARMREFYRPREAQLEHAPVDAGKLLHQVVELTRARWSDMPQERGAVIRLHEQVEADLPAIMGSDSEIRDAVTNLVLNAVDAMPEGGELTLRAFRDGATNRVGIEVCDTGVGMSEDVRTRCLEPFFTTKGERGTGLGLAMVYGMARRHDAELQIESAAGKGTKMRLLFPATSAAAVQRGAGPGTEVRERRILVIDDDPLLLRSVRDALEADGHVVEAAGGGQLGIDAFTAAQQRGEAFDFVLTDLGMPHVDGRRVAAAIKAMSPRTPVVLLTGWGHRLLATRDVPPGVDRVISKPPKVSELRQVLRDLGAREFGSDPVF